MHAYGIGIIKINCGIFLADRNYFYIMAGFKKSLSMLIGMGTYATPARFWGGLSRDEAIRIGGASSMVHIARLRFFLRITD